MKRSKRLYFCYVLAALCGMLLASGLLLFYNTDHSPVFTVAFAPVSAYQLAQVLKADKE